MAFINYTIVRSDGVVKIDGQIAKGVSMTGIPLTVHAIQWSGLQNLGTIEYDEDPETGVLPPPETFTDPADYATQTDEAEAIIYARDNPVTYYRTTAPVGQPIIVTTVGWPQPPNTTTLVPPPVSVGQTLQWNGSDWVVASFDITLSLPEAKSLLIQTTVLNGANAVNAEVALYSTVQQIEAPSVAALDTKTYPGTTIGEYQTYVDSLVASATATINAATTTEDLYSFNPADLPFTPATPESASGIIFTGRGSGAGPEDLNLSYYTEFNSISLDPSQTELYVPGTDTVIPYVIDIGTGQGYFDSVGNCFNPGDYLIQIRETATSFVIAEFQVPLNPTGENVSF